MSSYAASCCTCFRKASCAFAISGSSPTGDAPRSCHFASIYSAQRHKQSKISQAAKTQVIFGDAQNAVDRCRSSRGLPLSKSNFVLLLVWSLLPHEATVYNAKLLRVSARSASLRLAVLPTASLHFRQPSLRQNFAPMSLSSLSLPAAVLPCTVPAQLDIEPSHN